VAALSRILGLAGPLGAVALLLTAAAPTPAASQARTGPPELVVLVHGMGRTSWSMRPLAEALKAEGFEVMSFGYSSYCCTIPEIGEQLRKALASRVGPEYSRVHFVGHSLGNIVIRWVLTRDTLPPLVGRVVMLAPPNQGAHAANTFSPVVGWLLKPVTELQVDSAATVRRLPPVRGIEIGVIAAREDRTVKLPETHLEEETEHIVVDGGHSFIMRRVDVRDLMIAFLRTGRFMPAPTVASAP
jgi:pimeloyl-ACP methyl ester carboxylesterase